MSRQYDEYIEGKFEIDEQLYEIIHPSSAGELAKAYELITIIQNALDKCMHDDENICNYENLIQEQNDAINEYIEELGDFDNSVLAANIAYLLKQNGLRIGELEGAMGYSAGYISRTLGANAGKKLSIDAVWKIAAFFNVSIQDLIFKELTIPDTNYELAEKFIKRLVKKTQKEELEWDMFGGICQDIDDVYEDLHMVGDAVESRENVKRRRYYPEGLNSDAHFFLTCDMYSCRGVFPDELLVMARFVREDSEYDEFDYFLISEYSGKHTKKQLFNTLHMFSRGLCDLSELLLDTIYENGFDTTISKDMKKLIINFLSEEED